MKSDSNLARIQVTTLEPNTLYKRAADIFVRCAAEAIGSRGIFATALSGGSTPGSLYALLAQRQDEVDWGHTQIFFSDERCVPPDDAKSNYRMIRETLLDKAPVPPHNVHRMRGEMEPKTAAADYSNILRSAMGESPRFDLLLLGIGDDCHTASIFPGSDILGDDSDLAAAVYVPKLQSYRLTLTPPVIRNAGLTIVLAAGTGKAHALREAIEGPLSLSECPAQLLRSNHGKVVWLLDEDAASQLSRI
jgi:6-phosphogluconolactonase